MKYEGHAFNDSFENGKASGYLNLTREGVNFYNSQCDCQLPLNGLNIEIGGASGRIIFISNPNVEGWKFYTSDKSILQDPVIENNVHLKNQIKGLKKKKHLGLIITAVILAVFFGSLSLLWMAKDSMVHSAAEQIPVEWEQKLGDSAFNQFTAGRRLLTDEELLEQFDELIDPILVTADNGRFDYKFHIIEDSTLNAAAFPGGNMIIHTGLILTLETPEQLLGVIGHEMAHVNLRHSMRSLINNAGIYIVADAFLGGIGAISAVILNGGSQLLTLSNSRDHEKEADEESWDYMVGAGIDPRGLIESFEVMENSLPEVMKGNSEILDFVSTHPALSTRVKYLKEKWEKTPDKERFYPVDFDYKKFQESIRANLQEKSETKKESPGGSVKEEKNEN